MKKIILITIVTFLTACLQGPWSYNPEIKFVDRGIVVNAYIVADRPLSDVCFERLYDLDETYTNAWAFFDSATVEVTGDYGSGVETIELSQNPNKVMCFLGAPDKLGQRGEAYTLDGVFWWDSSGTQVRSVISGEAKIPTSINMNNTAWASSLVLSNDQFVSDEAGLLALFEGLPDTVTTILTERYISEINELGGDSLKQINWAKENGAQIRSEIDELLLVYDEYIEYGEGDTVSYLSDGLNLTSHYYKANTSSDVGGILITQRLDSNAVTPKNRFNEIAERFGNLDAAQFYSGSTIRRLYYIKNIKGKDFNVFDSMGVSNAYFESGRNVLYFYATDSNYSDWASNNIRQESNSKVPKKSYITGGNGIFAGMVMDSFVVNIRIPQSLLSYSKIQSHAAYCLREKWGDEDCREYKYEYCEQVSYNDRQYSIDNPTLLKDGGGYNTCLEVLVEKSLDENKSSFDLIKSSFPKDGWPVKANNPKVDSLVKFNLDELKYAEKIGLEQHCFKNNFSTPACADIVGACQSFDSKNDCRKNLWNYCIDNKWSGPSCGWGLHMYCLQSDVKSEILCGETHNNYCEKSPNQNVCKLES